MISDIFNKPIEITIDGKNYKLEYDNNAYIELENATGKGTFELFDKVTNADIGIQDCMNTALCAVLKHHCEEEVKELEKIFMQKPYLIMENAAKIYGAFVAPLIPPEVMQNVQKSPEKEMPRSKKKRVKKA